MMRLSLFLSLFLVFTLSSCLEESKKTSLPGYTGNQGELIVVAPEAFWNTDDADFLRNYLNAVLPGLPAAEPLFKAVEVKTEGFTHIFSSHRNILEIKVDRTNASSVSVKRDVNARGQTYVTMTLQQEKDLRTVCDEHLESVLWYFHKSELDRLMSRNRKFGSKVLNQQVAESTGLNIILQENFEVAKEEQDFLWLRLDRTKPVGGYQHQINQGILIYSRPYTDTIMFDSASLATWKNVINEKYVEGPHESYMNISYRLYPPQYTPLVFMDQTATEVRGLWRMEGAKGVFMGGPFYGLAFYNPENGRQYMVEGYVYGPQFNKRAFIREIEAVVKSVTPVKADD